MTWEIYEGYQNRRAVLRRPLSESAIAWLGSRGFDVRGKSVAEIKRQIAAQSAKPDRAKDDRARREKASNG